jgi:hypothetical protein
VHVCMLMLPYLSSALVCACVQYGAHTPAASYGNVILVHNRNRLCSATARSRAWVARREGRYDRVQAQLICCVSAAMVPTLLSEGIVCVHVNVSICACGCVCVSEIPEEQT